MTAITLEQAAHIAKEHNESSGRGDYLLIDPADWTVGNRLGTSTDVTYFRGQGYYALRIEDDRHDAQSIMDWISREDDEREWNARSREDTRW